MTTKSNKTRNKTRNKKRHLYRKRREIVSLPGTKGLPIFSEPYNKKTNKIYVDSSNTNKSSGNIIDGLRNYKMLM